MKVDQSWFPIAEVCELIVRKNGVEDVQLPPWSQIVMTFRPFLLVILACGPVQEATAERGNPGSRRSIVRSFIDFFICIFVIKRVSRLFEERPKNGGPRQKITTA